MGQPANTGSGGNIPNDNDCQFSGDSCTENENDDDNNNDIASNDYSNKAIKRKKKKEKSSDNRVKELGKRSSDIVLRQVVFSSCKTREKFRTIGRTIWMTIRAHPEAFYDHVAQVRQEERRSLRKGTKGNNGV